MVELARFRDGPAGAERLLLINGLGSPSAAFERGFVAAFVDAGFEVLRLDNRDVGQSPRATAPYTLDDMVDDTLGALDAEGWDRVHVVGQSLGGAIAQQLAIRAPERVRSLTSFMSFTGEPGIVELDDEILSALLTSPPDDPEAWIDHRLRTERLWCSPEHWDPTWVEAKARAMVAHGVDPAGSARQYRASVASGSRDAALADLDVPTLVLHGTADRLIPIAAGRHTASVIPGARLVEIDGMGHDLPPPLWDRIVGEIRAFVTEVVAED